MSPKTKADPADRLEQGILEAREVLRQLHEATKDARASIRELEEHEKAANEGAESVAAAVKKLLEFTDQRIERTKAELVTMIGKDHDDLVLEVVEEWRGDLHALLGDFRKSLDKQRASVQATARTVINRFNEQGRELDKGMAFFREARTP